MAGEENHDLGSEGLRRAKRWLEFTTRVDQSWTHQDGAMAELLEFEWPHVSGTAKPFTFDLGGRFRGGALHKQGFLAEVKNYKKESDLPTHFRHFLAKCYIALESRPKRCENFLWISWAPFQAQKWDEHATAASVQKALLHKDNLSRALGAQTPVEGTQKLNPETLTRVADRLWLVTLSSQQEQLVLSDEHYGDVLQLITQKGASW